MPHGCVYMDKIYTVLSGLLTNKQESHELETATLGIGSLEGRMKYNMIIFHCIYEKSNNKKHFLKETKRANLGHTDYVLHK